MIIDETPILTTSNQPVTGLPNTINDEVPYSYNGQTRLQLNPNGLDPEGLARATDGTFPPPLGLVKPTMPTGGRV